MHLLIDGYNLLHNTPELAPAQARGQGRAALLKALKLYRAKRRHKLTVVFDGGPDAQPSRGSESGVPVVYAGTEQSADDVIADLAAKHGPGVTVITDDRELAQRCAAKGSEVIASWEFAIRLMEAAQGKVEGLEAPEDDSGWDFTTKKKGPSKRLPKSKRRKAKKIKSL
jgi:predicted RNA-binding protein with PIN domain